MKKYSVLFEDDDLILVDKPQGMATTPGRLEDITTSVFKNFPELALVEGFKEGEGGLLNRLDNETGGIVFFAKSTDAFNYYSLLMKSGKVTKIYTAVVDGIPGTKEGIITDPIAHHKKNKAKMILASQKKQRGKPREAKTTWKQIQSKDGQTVLEVSITKGVRHQIRLHLASIGLPIAADKLYNNLEYPADVNHKLYANKVRFFNRLQNKTISVSVQVPFL